MQRHEYDTLVNKNAIHCWLIILIVLIVSYIGELIKGVRTPTYILIFSIVSITPWLLTFIVYKHNPCSKVIKYEFAVGYCLFYTYVMITTQTPVSFVYIVPMISIIMSYCNIHIIIGVFSYATLINLIDIAYMMFHKQYIQILNLNMSMTFWEIQIACLVLTGIFLFMSTKLLQKRNEVINTVVDAVYTDPLTGLNNVRFLDENSNSLFDYDKNCCLDVAFIDVDDFKSFNTKYGHSFGDIVLKRLSDILSAHVKPLRNTFAIRNGGDEFLIVSKTLCDDEFTSLIEDIRSEVEMVNMSRRGDENIHIAISVGVATKTKDGGTCTSFKNLYDKADFRNQKAKDSGKNLVVIED